MAVPEQATRDELPKLKVRDLMFQNGVMGWWRSIAIECIRIAKRGMGITIPQELWGLSFFE